MRLFQVMLLLLAVCLAWPQAALAAAGNINATDKYAWAENGGWINFHPAHGGASVYSDHLTGYVWAENIGWIKLGADAGGPYTNSNAGNWGVNHDGSGNLSGFGWSENGGWINFNPTHSQVTIDLASGAFDGYAWAENTGWIRFKNASPAYGVALWAAGIDGAVGIPTLSEWSLILLAVLLAGVGYREARRRGRTAPVTRLPV